jgi:hypothetical protein
MPVRHKGPKKRRPDSEPTYASDLEREIILRYATRDENGQLRRCGPRKGENPDENWRWAGNDGKAVMKDEAAAKECARQLAIASGKPTHSYRCPRSKSGHYHVSGGPIRKQADPSRRATL